MNRVALALAIILMCVGCSRSGGSYTQPYNCPDMSWVFDVDSKESGSDVKETIEAEYARREFSDVDLSTGGSARSKFCIGRAFLHLGYDVLAEDYFSSSIAIRDDVPGVHLERAVARLELANCEGAIDDVQSERGIGYELPGIPLVSAKANLQCENFREALDDFKEFRRAGSNGYLSAEDLVLEARILSALGRSSESVESYYKALDTYTSMHRCSSSEVCINPFASRLVNEIIDVQCRAGRSHEALRLYRQFANYQEPSVEWPWCADGSRANS